MKNLLKVLLYQPLYNLLIFLAWLVPGHSIGWAIILLTVLIRIILLPSSLKAARAQMRLQLLQPKINKLRAEIKDQQEQAKALMNLYKEEGVSPFGSCLPQLIQLPIILVLYQVFRNGLDTSRFSLLYSFVPHPESVNTFLWGIDLSKPDLWVLPIIAGLTQLVLSLLMMPPQINTGKAGEQDMTAMMMKQMTYIFPVMTLFIGRTVPAALALYWIVTNLFIISQQWYVNKNIKIRKEESKEVAKVDVEEIVHEVEAEKPGKKDFVSRIMDRRLKKQEKKSGVNITIRKKGG